MFPATESTRAYEEQMLPGGIENECVTFQVHYEVEFKVEWGDENGSSQLRLP